MSLSRQYEPALTELFDELIAGGTASTPKGRIKRWFDAEHFSVVVRRELRVHWDNHLNDLRWSEKPVLLIGDFHDNIILSRKDIYHPINE